MSSGFVCTPATTGPRSLKAPTRRLPESSSAEYARIIARDRIILPFGFGGLAVSGGITRFEGTRASRTTNPVVSAFRFDGSRMLA